MKRTPDERSLEQQDLERVEGVFVRRDTDDYNDRCDEADDRCAQDELVEDGVEELTPGTQDDLPYTWGAEKPRHADLELDTYEEGNPRFAQEVGETGAPEDGDIQPELGGPDERNLYMKERPLRQEVGDEQLRLRQISDEEAERVERALIEDYMEPLTETGEGTSSTGMPDEPQHGGFPSRDEADEDEPDAGNR